MAVGMQFLFQRPRQFARGLAAKLLQLRQQLRKMLAQLAVKIRIARGDLHQQQRVRHAKCGVYLRAVECLAQGLEAVADVLACWLRQRAGGRAHRGNRCSEQLGNALPHQRHRRHHRHAQVLLQRLDVDVQALVPRLVHHVERDDHGPAELGQFQREFQVALQTGGVDHLHDQVGRRERRGRAAGLMHGYGRALVSPEKKLQCRQIVLAEVVQRGYARQLDHAGFVEADLNRAFAVGAPGAGEAPGARRGAGHGVEQRALAGVGHADQGDAQAPLAAEQRGAQRHRGLGHCHQLAATAGVVRNKSRSRAVCVVMARPLSPRSAARAPDGCGCAASTARRRRTGAP